MVEKTNIWEKRHIPYRSRIPSNLCRWFSFKEVKYSSPLLRHGLQIMASFQIISVKEGKEWLYVGEIYANTISARWSRSTSIVNKHNGVHTLLTWCDRKWYFTPVVSSHKIHISVLYWGKDRTISSNGASYKISDHYSSKIIKVIKSKKYEKLPKKET